MVSGSARIPDELRLDDGTGMKSYVVACDELYCRPESGTAHAVAEPILPSAEEIATRAIERGAITAARFDLILYEKGVERSRATRLTLSRRILIELDGGIPARDIADLEQRNPGEDLHRRSLVRLLGDGRERIGPEELEQPCEDEDRDQ